MEIIFSTDKLRKYAQNRKLAENRLGAKRARLYLRRLAEMKAATSIDELARLPGKHHKLTGNRSGQWVCRLDGGYRLVYTPEHDTKGNIVKITLKILEITDYH